MNKVQKPLELPKTPRAAPQISAPTTPTLLSETSKRIAVDKQRKEIESFK
jgi:hypothetical protein